MDNGNDAEEDSSHEKEEEEGEEDSVGQKRTRNVDSEDEADGSSKLACYDDSEYKSVRRPSPFKNQVTTTSTVLYTKLFKDLFLRHILLLALSPL